MEKRKKKLFFSMGIGKWLLTTVLTKQGNIHTHHSGDGKKHSTKSQFTKITYISKVF